MSGQSPITIDQALADPRLLNVPLGDPATWRSWFTVLKAAFGLPLTAAEAKFFQSVAGRRPLPKKRVSELWSIVGRRSGKSRIAAGIASYIAAFGEHNLSPGETGYILVLAGSKLQANAVFDYVRAFFEKSPVLAQQIESIGAEEIRLKGNIVVAVHTANYRTIRGRTLLACIFDEAAFWRDEGSATPDVEVYRAVLPALMRPQGMGMLVGISSPYARRGLLYSKHQAAFGKPDDEVLVIQAPTLAFNPLLDAKAIQRAIDADPEGNIAEWQAEFRGDLSMFVDRAVVERCVEGGVGERPFDRRHRYVAFCDPSGGAHDSMTLGIAHQEGQRAILDVVREIAAPFNPHDVTDEFVRVLHKYGCDTVIGDGYGRQWVVDAFSRGSVRYVKSEHDKSTIYLNALPLLMSGQCILLDNRRLVSQISTLQRQTTAGGRDKVDHAKGSQDDLANAALGVLVCATGTAGRQVPAWVAEDMALGRESYAVPDTDPLDHWDVKPPQPKVRTRRANEWRWNDPGTQRWDTAEADSDPLSDG